MAHTKTGFTPHKRLFGVPSPSVKHVRSFGFKVMYLADPAKKSKSDNFSPLRHHGFNPGHHNGRIYFIISEDKVTRTEHVTFLKKNSPDFSCQKKTTPAFTMLNMSTIVWTGILLPSTMNSMKAHHNQRRNTAPQLNR